MHCFAHFYLKRSSSLVLKKKRLEPGQKKVILTCGCPHDNYLIWYTQVCN